MAGEIEVKQIAPRVAMLTIANPPSNALGDGVRPQLLAALEAIHADLDMRAVVLTGAGRMFCAGDDLREVAERGAAMAASLAHFQILFDRIETLRVPVIAAVNGPAFGGGLELALSCDIRISSDAGRFAASGVNIGLMASVRRLPRLIGPGRAKAMLLSGLPVDAATALSYGLVTEVHPAADLQDAAVTLASRIASRAPLSVEAAKRQVNRAQDASAAEAREEGALELAVLTASADHKQAIAAFLEKREPVFTRS